MDVLIVGSIAYDSLESPAGKSENELGGSATYGGFSAASVSYTHLTLPTILRV